MKLLIATLIILTTFQTLYGQIEEKGSASGMTTIKGNILNFDKYFTQNKTIEIQIPDWTNAYRRKYFADIDKNGNFSLTFFVFNTQEVYFTYRNNGTTLFISPEDTLKLNFNADTFPDNINFHGKTSKICQEYITYLNIRDSIFLINNSRLSWELTKTLPFDQYKVWRDGVYLIEKNKMENYVKKVSMDPFLSNWLIGQVKLRYQADIFSYNPVVYLHYNSLKTDSLVKVLRQIIKSVELDTLNFLINCASSYSGFINSMHGPFKQIAIETYFKNHQSSFPPKQTDDSEKAVPNIENQTKEETTKEVFSYFLKTIDLLVPDGRIKESVIAHTYTLELERQNVDVGLDSTLVYISNPDIKASLINEFNYYNWRTINQNSLKVDNKGDTLLFDLTRKYKGSVLYINFWGTWCGSCYSSFKYTREIKEKLADKKVAFIYLCYLCDKTKWEKDIKGLKLDGDHVLLTSDQAMHLSKTFNLIGVPRYIIIDKNGRIVNENAPRPGPVPQLQQAVIKELTKYLIN